MDSGCDWICDYCNAYMNDQPGFTTLFGTWRCTQCGALNDVSENNILDLLGMLAKGITSFVAKPLEEPEDETGDDDYE